MTFFVPSPDGTSSVSAQTKTHVLSNSFVCAENSARSVSVFGESNAMAKSYFVIVSNWSVAMLAIESRTPKPVSSMAVHPPMPSIIMNRRCL